MITLKEGFSNPSTTSTTKEKKKKINKIKQLLTFGDVRVFRKVLIPKVIEKKILLHGIKGFAIPTKSFF